MGLPPTSTKISTDANEVTTFKFDFPNFTGTHTGTDLSLGVNSVAGGGTGLATLTANNVILGNGTSNPTFVAPGTTGNVLTSNGTTWVSLAGGGGTGGFDYFNSAVINTNSNAIASTSFETFSNSPAFTFTPNYTGKYKVYAPVTLYQGSSGGLLAMGRIYNTAGTPSALAQNLVANATTTLTVTTQWPGQSFIPTSTATLSSAVFKLHGTGTISGPLYAQIYTDTAGSPGTLLETSQYVQSSTLTGTAINYSFYFSNTTSLTTSTTYHIVLNQGSVTGSGNVIISYDSTGSYGSGYYELTANSGAVWVPQVGQDLYFQVNTSINPATLIAESQIWTYPGPSGNSSTAQSVYSLVSGNSYTFDLQGATSSGGSVYCFSTDAQFYMFAERCG